MRNRGLRFRGLALSTHCCLPIAALLIALASPVEARAKPQQSGDGHVVQKSATAKSKSKASTQECERRVVPPFMYNPRFMNRGFFKPLKCSESGQ